MLREIPSELLSEWMAYAQLEPWGFEVDMYAAAISAAAVYNVNRKKGKKPFSPSDFIPEIKSAVENSGDFFKELKSALILQKGRHDNRKRTPRKARNG